MFSGPVICHGSFSQRLINAFDRYRCYMQAWLLDAMTSMIHPISIEMRRKQTFDAI